MELKTLAELTSALATSTPLSLVKCPESVYHGCGLAVSHSMLKGMRESPAKYEWALKYPRASSPAQVLGTAIHMAMLEPMRFDEVYARQEKLDRRTKEGKARAEEWETKNAGKTAISFDDYAVIQRVWDRASDEPFFAQFFARGHKEVSFFAQDLKTDIWLRCRTDNYIIDAETGKRIIVDLKTTDNASQHVFSRDIREYGYHTQAAFYMAVTELATGVKADAYVIAAIEKTRDCDMTIWYMPEEALAVGRRQIRRWLDRLADCRSDNKYPGYDRKFIAWQPPQWLADEFKDAEEF